MDVTTLAALLRETESHHGEYEPTAPAHDWSDWYAAYIVARQDGDTSDDAVARATRHTEAVRR
ncbi:hypothetical protein [Actinomycetospora lemnae]|uniref:Bleomycin resistance protein n=1 Tax=Actinomycetospora lemnae TaxID=3019891 RepID=A0ABT5SZ50_9PSEU|nr:hypothetical protein [Actinomycetospora sp. DW7H6]MDD7968127.1 hypothetical protein [Actinomycetospora sp. DW7H6]